MLRTTQQTDETRIFRWARHSLESRVSTENLNFVCVFRFTILSLSSPSFAIRYRSFPLSILFVPKRSFHNPKTKLKTKLLCLYRTVCRQKRRHLIDIYIYIYVISFKSILIAHHPQTSKSIFVTQWSGNDIVGKSHNLIDCIYNHLLLLDVNTVGLKACSIQLELNTYYVRSSRVSRMLSEQTHTRGATKKNSSTCLPSFIMNFWHFLIQVSTWI